MVIRVIPSAPSRPTRSTRSVVDVDELSNKLSQTNLGDTPSITSTSRAGAAARRTIASNARSAGIASTSTAKPSTANHRSTKIIKTTTLPEVDVPIISSTASSKEKGCSIVERRTPAERASQAMKDVNATLKGLTIIAKSGWKRSTVLPSPSSSSTTSNRGTTASSTPSNSSYSTNDVEAIVAKGGAALRELRGLIHSGVIHNRIPTIERGAVSLVAQLVSLELASQLSGKVWSRAHLL